MEISILAAQFSGGIADRFRSTLLERERKEFYVLL